MRLLPPPRAGRGKGDQKSLNLGHRGLILELQVTLPALAWIHTPAAPGGSRLGRRVSSRQRALGCAASFLEEPELGLNRSRISWKMAQSLYPARFWGGQALKLGTGEVMPRM